MLHAGPEPEQSTDADRELLDSLPLPIFSIDSEYRISSVNRAGLEFAGFDEEKAAPSKPLCHRTIYGREEICPYCPRRQDRAEAFGENVAIQKLIQVRTAARREASLRVTFTHTASGHLVEMLEDVTQERERQEETLRMENLAALGIMISGIAHELNNPLTGIGLNLQNLDANLASMDQNETRRRLGILRKDLNRASRIVSDVLSFSNPGRLRLTRAELLTVIERASATTRRLYPVLARQVEWRFPEESVAFFFDPEKIERLFINLFRNSIQAFDYKPGYVTIEVRPARKHVHVIVEDNAGGIAPENLKRIFQPFFSNSANGRGTGLGLSICHSIVREHGGRIHVRSFEGRTRFYVSLPRHTSGDSSG